MYLIDTNVISATVAAKAEINPALNDWLGRNVDRLFLSVVTITEITDGMTKARREGATRKADGIARWLEEVIGLYADRILAIDVAVARRSGVISDRARSCGHDPGLIDIIIAATADHHRMVVLTRNVRHFVPMGIAFHNPFDSLPVAV